MTDKLFNRTVCLLIVSSLSACGESPEDVAARRAARSADTPTLVKQAPGYGAYGGYGGYYGVGDISFIDDVATNVNVGDEITSLTFTDVDGRQTPLQDYIGEKSVVLVITRGNTNPICPYCTTQTSRLISNYPQFADRNAQVLVVYPIEHGDDRERVDAFLQATKQRLDDPRQAVPFPILLDVELKAVDHLGIRKDLSKPATYILNPSGRVSFAYVGADIGDRPSIDAMIKQLDADAPESRAPTTLDD